MQPDPVPTSTPRKSEDGDALNLSRSHCAVAAVISSVSGRGTRATGPTSKESPINMTWPIMC